MLMDKEVKEANDVLSKGAGKLMDKIINQDETYTAPNHKRTNVMPNFSLGSQKQVESKLNEGKRLPKPSDITGNDQSV